MLHTIKKINNRIVFVIIAMLLFSSFNVAVSIDPANKVKAAGVQLYVDLTNDTALPQVPSTVTTQPVIADATATDTYFAFTTSQAGSEPGTFFAISDTIKLIFPTGFTIANCTSATVDADNDTVTDGSGGISSVTYTYTFSATASYKEIELCVKVTSPSATAANYNVSIVSSNQGDFGAALVYSYDDAGPTYQNRVRVTAEVTPILTLSITTNSGSPVSTDQCPLGVLTIVSISTCTYRVFAGTNQTTGTSTLQIADITDNVYSDATRDGLTKGGGGTDANNIDNVAANTAVVAGTEGTGVDFSQQGTTYTTQGVYAGANQNPVPDNITTLASASGYIDGTVAGGGNYLLATHRASADAGTQTGSYVQWVQYTLVSAP